MTALTRKLLLAFAVVGLGASSTSSYVHYQLLTQPGFTSFCDVNSTVSCTEAYLSQYGSFLGVPVALAGVVFFALVLALAGLGGRRTSVVRENAPAYIFALSTVALAFVLYLAWASFFVLQAFCILCVITYVAVIAIFIISGGATPFPMTALPGRAARDVRTLVSSPFALVAVLLLLASAVTAIAAFPREGHDAGAVQAQIELPPVSDVERARFSEWWDLQPKVDIAVPDDGAKVVIVKFNDYQCPPCKMTHDAYKGLIARHTAGGDVKYVLKHFPLEAECNTLNANHTAACEAAAAVLMAEKHDTADKLESWLFANQGPPLLTPAQVRQAARDVGGIGDFDAQYPAALEEVRADVGLGHSLGVSSTPTFYINGRKLPQAVQPQYFNLLIELELERAK